MAPPLPVFRNTDAMTRRILTETKTVAVLGASNKPHRDSYEITALWIDRGYQVVPVNPNLACRSPPHNSIHGRTVVASIQEIPESIKIDLVDVFRNARHAREAVESAIAIGAKSIWFQEGVVDHEAAILARSHGLDVAMDVCPYHELPRLGIDGPNHRTTDVITTKPSPLPKTSPPPPKTTSTSKCVAKATQTRNDTEAAVSDRIEKRGQKRRKL